MAEPAEGTEEYYRRLTPTYRNQQEGGGVPPAVQTGVGAVKSAVTPTPPNYPPVPPGQILTDSGTLGTVARDTLIAANQAGVGVAGLPMGAINLLWRATGHTPPTWSEAQGPGSYGEFLTLPGLNPSTPFERELSAGARQAGSALPFMAAGAMGPIALGVNALGGFGGQTLTEAGYPTAGAAVQLATGLGSGLGSASRIPAGAAAPMWTNVGRTRGMTQGEVDSAFLRDIRNMERISPLTHSLPFGLGVIPNMWITRGPRTVGAPMPSGGTLAARQILGGAAMGGTIGTSSAFENAPPSISYAAPGQPAQPPGVTWTPPQ